MENLRGTKIVKQDSLMVENSHLYIKAKDSEYCELTIVDENGKKRKVGAYNVGETDNATQLIEVTKAELDTHVLNSTLIPNFLYKITGVQPFLYGGTDIYLKAISTNALEEKGMGKFYVPKYDKNVDRYGIFNGM